MCESRSIVNVNLTFFLPEVVPSHYLFFGSNACSLDHGPQPPHVFPQKPITQNVVSQLTTEDSRVARRNHYMYYTIIYDLFQLLSSNVFPKVHYSTKPFSMTHNSLKNINHTFLSSSYGVFTFWT